MALQQSTGMSGGNAMYDEIQRRLRTQTPVQAPIQAMGSGTTAGPTPYPEPLPSVPLPPNGNTGVTGGMAPGSPYQSVGAGTGFNSGNINTKYTPDVVAKMGPGSVGASGTFNTTKMLSQQPYQPAPAGTGFNNTPDAIAAKYTPDVASKMGPGSAGQLIDFGGAGPGGGPADGAGGVGQYAVGGDRTKLNDPNHQTLKYRVLRILSNFDPAQGITPAVLQQLNALGVGTWSGKGDKVSVSGGGPELEGWTNLDLITDFDNAGGKRHWSWQNANAAPAGSPKAREQAAAVAAAQAGMGDAARKAGQAGAGSGGSGTAAAAKPTTMESIFTERLKELMGMNPEALTADDPAVRGAIAASDLGLYRAQEMRQAQMAEQMAAEGLGDSGAMQAGTERGIQDMGEASAVMRSQIMLQELNARRDQLMQALQLGGATLDAKKQRDLAKQLATIDARIREKSIEVQKMLGLGNLALGYTQAGNQNQQFYDTLGWDMGKFQALYNQGMFT